MRKALAVVVAVFLAAALRRVDGLVHRQDDLGDGQPAHVLGQHVAAARPAHALHQPVAAQLAEQLLEIGQRDLLPPADLRERHRTFAVMHREVHHRRHRKAPLRRQSHGLPHKNSQLKQLVK
ncbi:hypothetical protein D3C83_43000 [compost metagenome]